MTSIIIADIIIQPINLLPKSDEITLSLIAKAIIDKPNIITVLIYLKF